MINFLKKFFFRQRAIPPFDSLRQSSSDSIRDCNVDVLDAMLNYIKNNSDRIIICSAKPKDFYEAIKYRLAQKIIDSQTISCPINTIEGRQLIVNAINDNYCFYNEGVPRTVNLCNLKKRKLFYTTSCDPIKISKKFKPKIDSWTITVFKPI